MFFLRIGDKMKKKILIGILISLTSVMFAQKTVSIESALDSAVSEIKMTVPSGVEIAVSRFSSDSQELSEWLAKETEARLIRTGKFKLLERNAKNLKIIDSELDYQYSGNVDDSSMVELGYRLGAKYLVYGSFEQFGGLMQFTLKTTNVESGEIPVIASYSISSSTKLTDLLGDERELNTAEDYLDMIARCQRKLTSIESEKNKEIQNITTNIFSKYQEEINKVKSVEKEPWESQFEYDNKISSEVANVEGKRDTELNGVESKVNIKYDNQYKMVELQMNKLVENLQNTSFVIKGDSIQVLLGTFNAEAKPKNWPVSIKSLDKLVNYTYNGKRTVSDADVKTEYKTMESARASNSLEGEIIYKILKGSSNFDYEIKVVSVRVYNSENGTTVVNETVNQMVGSVGANAQLSGESRYEKSAKKEKRTPAVSDYVAREDTEINNVSINVTNEIVKSSRTATIENPFLNADDWNYNSDRTSGYINAEMESISFEGEEFDAIAFYGNTGSGGPEYSYQEIRCFDESVNSFIRKGDVISFKVLGDGKRYNIRLRMSMREGEYTDYSYLFSTKKNKVVEVKIPYTKFRHVSYTDYKKFDKAYVIEILLNVEDAGRNKDYSFKIFDAKVY